jgi:hypothetical protein
MAGKHAIVVDLADVWETADRKGKPIRTLAWGDLVTVKKQTPKFVELAFTDFVEQPDGSVKPQITTGYIVPKKGAAIKAGDTIVPKSNNKVLKVNFVDVQQGDGAVIESPAGKVMLVDGGDNQMFARYLAGRFRGTTLEKPQPVECILVTHGDADHFAGLPKILDSETNSELRKRLFMAPKRIYHNGIIKRPDKVKPETKRLGPTKTVGKDLYLTGLVDNLLTVPDSEMNGVFLKWKKALKTYNGRS